MSEGSQNREIVLRDLLIFQIKLGLDGIKDLVVSQLAILAAILDIVLPTDRRGKRFYAVMRRAERFDGWLSLYGAAEKAGDHEEGLFGASLAGSDSLLGKLEEMVLGRKETSEDGGPQGPDFGKAAA